MLPVLFPILNSFSNLKAFRGGKDLRVNLLLHGWATKTRRGDVAFWKLTGSRPETRTKVGWLPRPR